MTVAVMVDQTTWGDRLRRIRLNRGMDQTEFALLTGLTRPAIGKYELMADAPRAHRLIENSVELVFGAEAAAFLRGPVLPHLDSNQKPADYPRSTRARCDYQPERGRLTASARRRRDYQQRRPESPVTSGRVSVDGRRGTVRP